MNAFDALAEIELIETPGMLEFRLTPVFNVFNHVLIGLVVAFIVAGATKSWVGLLAGPAVVAALYFYGGNDKSPRVLQITDGTLFAFGRGEELSLRWKDVMRLEFRSVEDGPSGLAAKTGRLEWVWLVQDVSQDEAETMIDAIWKRFPLVENAIEPPGLLERWVGRNDGSSLGLNSYR